MAGEVTSSFDTSLVVQAEPKATIIRRSPSPLLTDPKGKWVCSSSLTKKVKKNKGPPLSSDLISGPSEVPIPEDGVEGGMAVDVARVFSTGTGKSLKERKDGLAALTKA